jgi:hypothetical protein
MCTSSCSQTRLSVAHPHFFGIYPIFILSSLQVRLWEIASRSCQVTLTGHSGAVTCLGFTCCTCPICIPIFAGLSLGHCQPQLPGHSHRSFWRRHMPRVQRQRSPASQRFSRHQHHRVGCGGGGRAGAVQGPQRRSHRPGEAP